MNVRCSALVMRGSRVLLMRYNYPDGELHTIPGGGLEQGETMPQCLTREFKEELGVDLEIGPMVYTCDMFPVGKIAQTVHLVFQARIKAGEPQLNPEHTSAEAVVWVKAEDLSSVKLYPPIKPAILTDFRTDSMVPRYLGNCTPPDFEA